MYGYVEQISVRIHRAVFRIWPRRRPGCHRLIPFREPLLNVFEVVDLEAEMINAAWCRLTAIVQDRKREIAVAHIDGSAALGMDDCHSENLLVEFGEARG